MPFQPTRAGQVHHTDRGDGPPVVLLHANLHDHHDYDLVAAALAGRYRVIAVDWPGHGRSDHPEPPADAFGLAGTLADLVDRLDLPPAVYVGNSVGGYAAARLAIDRPDRVAGLVLVNAGGFTGSTPVTRTLCRLLGTPALNRFLQPPLVPRYMRAGNDHDRAVTARALARSRTSDGIRVSAALWRSFGQPGYDLRAHVGRITAPVLLAWGTRDVVLPRAAGEATQRAIPGSQLHTFDTGHVVFASAPDAFVTTLEPFLAQALHPHDRPRQAGGGASASR